MMSTHKHIPLIWIKNIRVLFIFLVSCLLFTIEVNISMSTHGRIMLCDHIELTSQSKCSVLSPIQGAYAQQRTWFYLPTGNGHGFQVFDRQAGRITYFLEHPYRYVAPSGTSVPYDRTIPGVGRRDLAHDIYFGVKVNGQAQWLNTLTGEVRYEAQSNIIQATTRVEGVDIDTYYYAPFGYEGNAMVMLIRARNTRETQATQLTFFAKPNLKFGSGRTDPGEDGEQLQWDSAKGYAVETGSGGGHALYVPIGGVDRVGCGSDSALYNAVQNQGEVNESSSCSGTSQVLVAQKQMTLNSGEEAWWGMAILFVNDNPNHQQAFAFKDERSVETIFNQWQVFAGEQSAQELHEVALSEWEEWRVNSAPAQLSESENVLWRQSETVLRMGQVREPTQDNRRNYGMYLASVPVGEWHTGWVRDGVYALVAMAMTGHYEEARIGVEFYLNAEQGVFSQLSAQGTPYRVSSCRYFGNGQEEADGNQAGPNLETDGWGLVLWGASMYLQYSCHFDWLSQTTLHGDTVFEALYQIAQDIDRMIEPSTGLPKGDCSIWEVHWDLRQTFTYTTAAQIRGLYDFAQIAYLVGREDLAQEYWEKAARMHNAAMDYLVYRPLQSLASHRGVSNREVHVDGSTVEMLSWGLIQPTDPVFTGTLSQYDRLKTGFGGYRRLEPNLSLTGESGANEYDLSEWILLDLRIGSMWRLVGEVNFADELLNKITRSALVNDHLIPELFEPNSGDYAGVVPMVGYGAGAWQMAQLDKYGAYPPTYGAGFGRCQQSTAEGGVMNGGAEVNAMGGAQSSPSSSEGNPNDGGAQSNSGFMSGFMPNDSSNSNLDNFGGRSGFMPNSSSQESESYDWESDQPASLCSAPSGEAPLPWGLIILMIMCTPRSLYKTKTRLRQD